MRILSISAQKPSGTGSGTALSELIRVFAAQGHEQAAIAGISKEDSVSLPDGVRFYPVYFETAELPFPVVGMSDVMPYNSTRYRDMTPEMVRQFQAAFLRAAEQAVKELDPDLIVCHHLYLLAATVRNAFPDRVICGISHNTDLRQMEKTDLERDVIRDAVRGLDHIFVLKKVDAAEVERIYGASPEKISVIGTGYNRQQFYTRGVRKNDGKTRLIFVGKICEKKGVLSLLRCLDHLRTPKETVEIILAGAAGDPEEYANALRLTEKSSIPVKFFGMLSRSELAELYNACDIFVLPSFFEGIPLTLLEALACGERAVVSDLPGLRDWMDEFVSNADVRYVPLPAMKRVDEPDPDGLPGFERRLAQTLEESIAAGGNPVADLSKVSWEGIAESILSHITA